MNADQPKLSLHLAKGILILTVLILFEAFQQRYYVKTYELASGTGITIYMFLLAHVWRWVIWLLTAIPFYFFIKKQSTTKLDASLLSISLVIGGLMLIDILVIAFVALFLNEPVFSLKLFYGYFEFFVFQKGPIFLIAYITLAIYAYQYYVNQSLVLRIDELLSVKEVNAQSYRDLKNKNWDDDTKVLQVKTGNKIKLIPIEEIDWIESDDYCVKIHTRDSRHYSLRTSMKRMEKMLEPYDFHRVHRSAIVNSQRIVEIITGNKPAVILPREVRIDVTPNRMAALKQIMLPTLNTPSQF